MAAARGLRRRGDDAGAGTAAPRTLETGGASQCRGPRGDQGHRLHPRRTRGGHTETAKYAQRHGLVDVALASVMRDGLLRVSEAAALRWGNVERAGDGSGRIRIAESQGDQEGDGVVLYLGRAAVQALLAIRPGDAAVDGSTRVFGLHPDTIRRRLQQAAQAAGLPGWREITGHSGRVGMAQDLSAAGFGLPELMTAGRWKSPKMPARYTERQEAGRGAVARYYQRSRGGRGSKSLPWEARVPSRARWQRAIGALNGD